MRTLFFVIFCLGLGTLTGCGSIFNLGYRSLDPRLYGGVELELYALSSAPQLKDADWSLPIAKQNKEKKDSNSEEERKINGYVALLGGLFILMDLPFTVAADTVLLPIVWLTSGKKCWDRELWFPTRMSEQYPPPYPYPINEPIAPVVQEPGNESEQPIR